MTCGRQATTLAPRHVFQQEESDNVMGLIMSYITEEKRKELSKVEAVVILDKVVRKTLLRK